MHYLDDITNYLDQNQHVLNTISVIDRGFLDMEILKPIFRDTPLVGMHSTGPLMTSLLDTDTKNLIPVNLTTVPVKTYVYISETIQ